MSWGRERKKKIPSTSEEMRVIERRPRCFASGAAAARRGAGAAAQRSFVALLLSLFPRSKYLLSQLQQKKNKL